MPWLLVNKMRPWRVSSGVGSFFGEYLAGERMLNGKSPHLKSQTHPVSVPGLTLISSGVVGKSLHFLGLLFPL